VDVPVEDVCEGRMPALTIIVIKIRSRLLFLKERGAGKSGVSLNSLRLGECLLPTAREACDCRVRSAG
jgi:hypothetical protein